MPKLKSLRFAQNPYADGWIENGKVYMYMGQPTNAHWNRNDLVQSGAKLYIDDASVKQGEYCFQEFLVNQVQHQGFKLNRNDKSCPYWLLHLSATGRKGTLKELGATEILGVGISE